MKIWGKGLFQDEAMDLLAFRGGQKDKQELFCCAIEEYTKIVFWALGKMRRCGGYGGDHLRFGIGNRKGVICERKEQGYGFSKVILLVPNPVEV
jgi:hypothetical protein